MFQANDLTPHEFRGAKVNMNSNAWKCGNKFWSIFGHNLLLFIVSSIVFQWIVLNGYGLYGEELIERAVDLAKDEGARVAMDLSSFEVGFHHWLYRMAFEVRYHVYFCVFMCICSPQLWSDGFILCFHLHLGSNWLGYQEFSVTPDQVAGIEEDWFMLCEWRWSKGTDEVRWWNTRIMKSFL